MTDLVYLCVKALHVIAAISWMAGMLYLPRLFVYHAEAAPGSDKSETFKVMERRLLRGIINPAMIVALACGLWMLHRNPTLLQMPWMHLKIMMVIALLGVHGFLGRCRRAFAEDRNRYSARFYRILNEVPALLLIGIVIMVIVRPWLPAS